MMTPINSDLFRYTGRTTGLVRSLLRFPGLRFSFFYRLCRIYSAKHPVGIVSRIWFKHLQVKFGFQIPHTCKIGPGLFLGHYGNIVINSGVLIGSSCSIAQGVTIGNTSRGKRKGCPTLGDRVWIGANAVLVGNISIGNDVLIAPLSFVNFDVPDHMVVSGNPAKIVSEKGSEGYVKNVVI